MKKIFITGLLMFGAYMGSYAQCATNESYFEARLIDADLTVDSTDFVLQMRYVAAGPPEYGSDPTGASSTCATVIPDATVPANETVNAGMVFGIVWDAGAYPTFNVSGAGASGTGAASEGANFATNPFSFVLGSPSIINYNDGTTNWGFRDFSDGAAAVNSLGTWVDGQWYNVWRITTTGAVNALKSSSINIMHALHTGVTGGASPFAQGCPYLAQAPTDLSSFCEVPFKVSVVLPIELKYFTGVKDGNTSLLKWQTVKEEKVSHFVIERSNDGLNFNQVIGEVASQSNGNVTSQEFNYSLVDKTPKAGHNYYRLKTVETNGSSSYSHVVDLYFEEGSNVSIYPNPVIDELNVDIDALASTQATVKIIDVAGKIVKSIEYKLVKGQNTTKVSLDGFAAGTYTVKITDGKSINYTQQIQKL